MTDCIMLRGKIESSGLKLSFICDKLGISYTTLQRKIDGKAEFSASEMLSMCDLLGIKDISEQRSIFFR